MRRIFALMLFLLAATPVLADEARLDRLFEMLKEAGEGGWLEIEDQIWEEWAQSGSPAMDLLLERGRLALELGDTEAAVEHFTALVENAPDFAEGWNARATAYYNAELYGPALSDVARVLALEPRHFGALAGLGAILEEAGELEAAKAAYEAALAIHPYRPDLREAVDRLGAALQGTAI